MPFACDIALKDNALAVNNQRRPADVISGSEMFLSYFAINFIIALSGTIASGLIIMSQHNPVLKKCKSFGDFCLFLTFLVWCLMLLVGSVWRFSFAGKACAGEMYNSRLAWI